ncbi:MAG: 16S rRNA (uracil(1498)-N(3))-methyltransferase [Nitrospirota bacterium]
MPRLFLPSEIDPQREVLITGEEAHYLLAVLRMKAGEEFSLFDPSGRHFRARISRAGRKDAAAELLAELPPARDPARPVVLVQGMLKSDKMDLVVRKSTELGVSRIVPVVAERSQVRRTRKGERWRKVAREASRQCFRTSVPEVDEPLGMAEFLSSAEGFEGFVFWEGGGSSLGEAWQLKPSSEPLVVAIGPEGGFTEEEVDLARRKGLEAKSLGERILRAETAAVAALTVVQFLLGELG